MGNSGGAGGSNGGAGGGGGWGGGSGGNGGNSKVVWVPAHLQRNSFFVEGVSMENNYRHKLW